MAIARNTIAMLGFGDFANQIAEEPAKQTAAKKFMPAPSFLFLMGVFFINICALMLPNDPKLSHGAENCKREFAAKRKIKEQSPLAPARC
jgi:hypothetical protein